MRKYTPEDFKDVELNTKQKRKLNIIKRFVGRPLASYAEVIASVMNLSMVVGRELRLTMHRVAKAFGRMAKALKNPEKYLDE